MPVYHKLREKNIDTMTAVCQLCGPVKLVKVQAGVYRCEAVGQRQRDGQRAANQARDRRTPRERLQRHVLTHIEADSMTAVCRLCGPVEIVGRGVGKYRCHNSHMTELLIREYGMTLSEYDALAKSQGWKCALCRRGGKLHVDHDHDTGAVRGLLCGSCNRALGLVRDDIATLRRAIRYLENQRGKADHQEVAPNSK